MVPGTARWIGETSSIRGIKFLKDDCQCSLGLVFLLGGLPLSAGGALVTNWGGGDDALVLCYSNGFADYDI